MDASGAAAVVPTGTQRRGRADRIDRCVNALADGGLVQWAIDLNAGGAALVISLLLARDQHLLYIPGRIVHHASAAYRGDGKTDAKDAAIIADQAPILADINGCERFHLMQLVSVNW